jgi:hypothetical protein
MLPAMAIPESARRTLQSRLEQRRAARWPELIEVRLRFRGNFAYVDGVLAATTRSTSAV